MHRVIQMCVQKQWKKEKKKWDIMVYDWVYRTEVTE